MFKGKTTVLAGRKRVRSGPKGGSIFQVIPFFFHFRRSAGHLDFGIVIGIFPREHPPPHFHAVYGEYQITVDIETGVVHGDFPRRALRHVLEWFDLHQQELLDAWERVQAGFPPNKIAPLE